MDTNLSRKQLLLSLAAIPSLGLLGSGCTRTPLVQDVRFFGTATLDVGAKEWSYLLEDEHVRLAFKDNGNDAGPVIAQMTAGTAATDYDLGGLLGGAEAALAAAGAILPWDMSKVPNWSTAWPWAQSIAHSKWQNQQFGIPLVVNADSMIYLPDRLSKVAGYETGVVDSYAAVFDERLRGKTAMEDTWTNSVIFTAIYLKQSGQQRIGDPGNLTESELRGVMEFLIDKKRSGQFRTLWNGWEQGVEVLRSGEVWVMTGWEPIVKALVDQGINARYATPKEGYEGWSIDLLLHAGAKKRGMVDTCHRVANWLLAGRYGSDMAVSRGYAVPNTTTTAFAATNHLPDANKIADSLNHVQQKLSQTIFWQNVRPDNFRLYEEWWSKFKST
jgi:putative spermidine/putrescine transport system substrate-binding protein